MATYPLVPNRISQKTDEFKTTVVKFEAGYEQRSANHSVSRPTFILKHQLLNMTNLGVLIDFFKARKGAYEAFYFVNHIDGVTYICRFAEDKLNIEYVNAYIANADVELKVC